MGGSECRNWLGCCWYEIARWRYSWKHRTTALDLICSFRWCNTGCSSRGKYRNTKLNLSCGGCCCTGNRCGNWASNREVVVVVGTWTGKLKAGTGTLSWTGVAVVDGITLHDSLVVSAGTLHWIWASCWRCEDTGLNSGGRNRTNNLCSGCYRNRGWNGGCAGELEFGCCFANTSASVHRPPRPSRKCRKMLPEDKYLQNECSS